MGGKPVEPRYRKIDHERFLTSGPSPRPSRDRTLVWTPVRINPRPVVTPGPGRPARAAPAWSRGTGRGVSGDGRPPRADGRGRIRGRGGRPPRRRRIRGSVAGRAPIAGESGGYFRFGRAPFMGDNSSPADLGLDTGVPHSARVWNYWLGGKDNYPVDRQVGEQVRAVYPEIVEVARHSRAFLGRAVRHLAGEEGVTQFLDIGTGLPTVDNTHEVAQRVDPSCRIVYVDNDPLVLVHARALLKSTPEGACDYLDADVRDPAGIIERASATLDFDRPIGLMMLGILGNVEDDDEARAIRDHLVGALPGGSFLVLEDGTAAVN